MLVHAAAESCPVVGSSTAAAAPPSLSARRDSERASRSSARVPLHAYDTERIVGRVGSGLVGARGE
jgi:hypothetical protein